MSVPLSAHYLQIDWRKPGVAATVEVAPEPIEIETTDNGDWAAETLVFHDLQPWVGLRLEAELSDVVPAFETASGDLAPMLAIHDARGQRWWVQNDGWDDEKGRHLSELHRTMGLFTIVIGPRRLRLSNVVDRAGKSDLESFLADFQGDLFWLVLGQSGASADGRGGPSPDSPIVEALEELTAAVRRVLKHPARVVHEIQAIERLGRLRPNGATFRQYAKNPAARRLPGRGALESADHADNRYLRHMVQIAVRLAAAVARPARSHHHRLAEFARVEEARAASLQEITHRKVDPEVFDRQLEELRESIEKLSSYQEDQTFSPTGERLSIEFRKAKSFNNSTSQFFANITWREPPPAAHDERPAFHVLDVNPALVSLMTAAGQRSNHYIIEGFAHHEYRETKHGKLYEEIFFERIDSIQVSNGALQKKEEQRIRLEKSNWIRRLGSEEIAEARQESSAARQRGAIYRARGERALHAAAAMDRCRAELRQHDLKLERIGVRSSPALPLGVRYTQSPDYAACKAAFERVVALAADSGVTTEALDEIDRIGVLHASALYERWCLVKTLLVLVEDFRFQPESGWQNKLVKAVAGKRESVSIELFRPDVGMTARLQVQPVLANGRRPDLRLWVSSIDPTTGNGRRTTHRREDTEVYSAGLVMDAKFRTRWRYNELRETLDSLRLEKRYGLEGDRIFILHPVAGSVHRPLSPLEWARDCDYGQDFETDHEHGAIRMVPSTVDPESYGHLKRLLALHMQSVFPTPPERDTDEPAALGPSISFCVHCGQAHSASATIQKTTRSDRPYWVMTCEACKGRTTRTHCYGCTTRSLFKNGPHATYHRTLADQITNIVCPRCGIYFVATAN